MTTVYKGLATAVCRANLIVEERGMTPKMAVHSVTNDGNVRQLACMLLIGSPRDSVAWAHLYCESHGVKWEQEK